MKSKKFNQKKFNSVKSKVFGYPSPKARMSAYEKTYGKVPKSVTFGKISQSQTPLSMSMKTTTSKRK